MFAYYPGPLPPRGGWIATPGMEGQVLQVTGTGLAAHTAGSFSSSRHSLAALGIKFSDTWELRLRFRMVGVYTSGVELGMNINVGQSQFVFGNFVSSLFPTRKMQCNLQSNGPDSSVQATPTIDADTDYECRLRMENPGILYAQIGGSYAGGINLNPDTNHFLTTLDIYQWVSPDVARLRLLQIQYLPI